MDAAAPTSERRTVNIPQAIELLGRSRRTIYYWLKSGRLEFKKANGSVRIFEDSVRRVARKGQAAA